MRQAGRDIIRRGSYVGVLTAAGLLLLLGGAPVAAGKITNKDKQTYKVRIYWDDLSPTIEEELPWKGEAEFADKGCTIELMGKKDNIYVMPGRDVIIRGGVLRHVEVKEEK